MACIQGEKIEILDTSEKRNETFTSNNTKKVTAVTPPTELFQNLSRFRRESTFPLLEICIEDPRVD